MLRGTGTVPVLFGSAFPAGMVARWTLDDTSAGYVDLIAGRTLTASGTVTSAAGIIGNAAEFNGSSYLTTPDASPLRLAAGLAVECWFRPASVASAYGILTKYTFGGVSDEWGLFQNNATVGWRAFNAGGAVTTIFSGNVLSVGTFVHLVGVVHSDLTLRLYVNGALAAGPSAALASLSAPAVRLAVAVGALPGGTAPLPNGSRIDEPPIWQFGGGGDPGAAFWNARYNAGLGVRP